MKFSNLRMLVIIYIARFASLMIIFGLVRQMEQDGHVVRRHVGGNRRRQYVFLTASGKALEQHLIPLAIDVNKIALGAIGELKVTSMRETLLTMIENLAASENGEDNV